MVWCQFKRNDMKITKTPESAESQSKIRSFNYEHQICFPLTHHFQCDEIHWKWIQYLMAKFPRKGFKLNSHPKFLSCLFGGSSFLLKPKHGVWVLVGKPKTMFFSEGCSTGFCDPKDLTANLPWITNSTIESLVIARWIVPQVVSAKKLWNKKHKITVVDKC